MKKFLLAVLVAFCFGIPTQAQICGTTNDQNNHVPTDWTTHLPQAKGHYYQDATFGCFVTRITDVSTEDNWQYSGAPYLPILVSYSTISPFNANDTFLMLVDGWGNDFVTDLVGNIIVPAGDDARASGNQRMPTQFNNGQFLWDAANPNVFYYTYSNSLMMGTISGTTPPLTVTTTTVHTFSEYTAINFMDASDISQDGRHVTIVGGDTTGMSHENVFVYNFVTNTKGPVYLTMCSGSVNGPNNITCLHKLIITPGNDVIIQFANDGTSTEEGNRFWNGTSPLPHIQDTTNHLDTGIVPETGDGLPVFVDQGTGTLSGITNPCPSGWGLDLTQIENPTTQTCLVDEPSPYYPSNGYTPFPPYHVSWRGSWDQPSIVLSMFDQSTGSNPEWFDSNSNLQAPSCQTPSTCNWIPYKDEVVLVRYDADNNYSNVYRLARAYSRTDESYDAQVFGAISRDGKYIAFTSDMAYAHTGCPSNFVDTVSCTDVYVINLAQTQ